MKGSQKFWTLLCLVSGGACSFAAIKAAESFSVWGEFLNAVFIALAFISFAMATISLARYVATVIYPKLKDALRTFNNELDKRF